MQLKALTADYPAAATAASGRQNVNCPQLTTQHPQTSSSVGTRSHWMFVPEIEQGSRRFQLRRPITIHLEQEFNSDGSSWQANSPKYGIYAFGRTIEEAITEFGEDFGVVWDGLAFEKDENLTRDAQELKQALLDLVI